MEIPIPVKWTAGDEPVADDFNERISDVVEFLLEPPQVKVRQTSQQLTVQGSFITIDFDTCDKDNDTMWDADYPDRVTIVTPGWYEIEFGASIGNTVSAGYRVITALIYNGDVSAANGGRRGRSDSVTRTDTTATWVTTGGRLYSMFLNADDYIGLLLYQNYGSSKYTYVTDANAQPFMSLKWVSL